MTEIEFNKSLRELNKAYRNLFKVIPRISDYSCTRDEYVNALKKSIEEGREIASFLKLAVKPKDKDTLV